MELYEFFIIGLVGAFLTLDTTTLVQSFVSQPVIACTMIGWLGNDIGVGIEIGMIMQFLWITNIPVGAAIIPGGNGAAMIAAALTIHLNRLYPEQYNLILILVIFYAILLSYVGAKLRSWHRNSNVFILEHIMKGVEKGDFDVLGKSILFSVVLNYLRFFIIIFVGLILGDMVLSNIIGMTPSIWNIYAKYTMLTLWAIGLGLGMTLYDKKDVRLYILIGIVLGIVTMRFVI